MRIDAGTTALDPRGPIGIDQFDVLARWPMVPRVVFEHLANGILGVHVKHPVHVLADFADDIGQVPHGSREFLQRRDSLPQLGKRFFATHIDINPDPNQVNPLQTFAKQAGRLAGANHEVIRPLQSNLFTGR